MEYLIGITFNNYVLLASDTTTTYEITILKHDENKQFVLGEDMIMAVCGEPSHTIHFADFMAKTIQLEKLRNGYKMSAMAIANLTRKTLADSLRSTKVYSTNLLMAGYNNQEGSTMFYIDFLGTMGHVPYAVHGCGSFLTLGILDSYHYYEMAPQNGYNLLRDCIEELEKRFVIKLTSFTVSMINAKGIHALPDIETTRR